MAAHIGRGGNLETLLARWRAETGPCFEWRVPGGPGVVVATDPEAIREAFEVMQLPKSPRYSDLLPLLGAKSMVLTEGAEWAAQRSAFNPGFGSAFLRGAVPQFVACTRRLLARLEAAADEGEAADEGRPLPPRPAAAAGGGPTGLGDAEAAAKPGVVLLHHLVILLVGALCGCVEGPGGGRGGYSTTYQNHAEPQHHQTQTTPHNAQPRQTLEVILKVGFGEDAAFLAGAGVDDPLYASFARLGRHVSFFLDNPALNFMKALPWNAEKTRRLQRDYDSRILRVLARRLRALGLEGAAAEAEAAAAAGGVAARAAAGGGGGGGGCPVMHHQSAAAPAEAAAAAGQCPVHAAAAESSSGGSSNTAGSGPRTILEIAVNYSAANAGTGGSAGGSAGDGAAAAAAALDVATLCDQIKTFAAAGHDTTAALVAWSVYYLTQRPGAAAKLAAEVDAVLSSAGAGGSGSGSGSGQDHRDCDLGDLDVTWQQLTAMPYLSAVIKETLRLRPPGERPRGLGGLGGGGALMHALGDHAGLQLLRLLSIPPTCPLPLPLVSTVGIIARWAPEGATLSGLDVGGKVLLVSPFLQHTDEKVWGADANEWRPERWLEMAAGGAGGAGAAAAAAAGAASAAAGGGRESPDAAAGAAVHPYSYMPFSRGARDCIGSKFAVLEAKVILTMVFARFDLEYARSEPEGLLFSVTAHPRSGVPVRVRRRRRREAAQRQEGVEVAAGAGEVPAVAV